LTNSAKPATRLKAAIAVAILLVVLVSNVALASSYWSTLWFNTSLTGATRHYDGTNVHIDMHSTTNGECCNAESVYYIQLHRKTCWVWCTDDYIGQVSVPRNGWSGTKTWTNVGAGDYYFYFYKTNDGVHVSSSDVHMYN
jgi:hypothetical protein